MVMPVDDDHLPLLESEADPDPFAQFERWFTDAATVVANPEAMAVASADGSGQPSVRMVLLKHWDRDGYVFYTNYGSRKGTELAGNPRTALLFYWSPRGRQVRIEGSVGPVAQGEADAYFATRPRGAQIGALASHQSEVIADRQTLAARVDRIEAEYVGREIPRPSWWGGLRVVPQAFEFWQNRQDRLHDRLRYMPRDGGWAMARLQP
jgi:pyridoxamine 5'-phosphate oxidase